MRQLRSNINKMLADMRSELDSELAAIVAECEQKSDDFTDNVE